MLLNTNDKEMKKLLGTLEEYRLSKVGCGASEYGGIMGHDILL